MNEKNEVPFTLSKGTLQNSEMNQITMMKTINEEHFALNSLDNTGELRKETIILLERFFQAVIENQETMALIKQFEAILAKGEVHRDIIFLCFWLPFIQSNENFVLALFEKKAIQCGDQTFTNMNNISMSTAELNTHAFNVAVFNEFPESLMITILKQGKIRLSLDWVLEKMQEGDMTLVEVIWEGANECYIKSSDLRKKFFENFKDEKDLNNIRRTTTTGSIQAFNPSASNLNLINLGSGSGSKDMKNLLLNELKEFFKKGVGRVSMLKLIMLANCMSEGEEENNGEDKKELHIKAVRNLIRTICLFDKSKKQSVKILEGLYMTKQKKLANELLDANLLSVDINVFRVALHFKDIKFSLKFYNLFSDFKIYDSEKLHNELIDALKHDNINMEVHLFFIRMFNFYFNLTSTKYFLKIVEELLGVSNPHNKIMGSIANPIKIFVLIAEVLKALSKNHPTLEYSCHRLMEKALEYSESIQNIIDEDNIFREVILEKDINNRTLLEIISQNDFLILLKNNLVEKITEDLWKGPYITQGSFFEASSQYQSLGINSKTKDYDAYTKQRSYTHDLSERRFKSNFTHFKVWRKNVYLKFYFELVVSIIVLAAFQISALSIFYFYQAIIGINQVQVSLLSNTINAFLSNNTFNQTLASGNLSSFDNYTMTVLTNSTQMYSDFNSNIQYLDLFFTIIIYLCIIFLCYPFGYVVRMIFAHRSSKPNMGDTVITDFALFILIVIIKIVWNFGDIDKIHNFANQYSSDDINNYKYLSTFGNDLSYSGSDPLNQELSMLSVICFLLWFKILIHLKGTKPFGSLIVIFLLAFKGIAKYLILFLLVTIIYACFGILNFYRINDYFYKNIMFSFTYYFLVSTGGEPNYAEYNDASLSDRPYYPWLGAGAIIIIIIFNNIIFFNLIIALLTNIYDKYQTHAIQLYIQQRLNIRKKFYSDDERFDSLLISVFPFDIVSFPFALAFLFVRDVKKAEMLNTLILKINFYLYAVIYITTFSICTALLIPVVYLKIMFSKFFQLFVDEIQQYFFVYKCLNVIVFIIFGLLLQVKAFISDLFSFCKLLEREDITLLTANESNGKFSIKEKNLKLIVALLKDHDARIRISSERFLLILTKCYVGNESIKELHDMLTTFDLENSENMKKHEKTLEEFDLFNNAYREQLEKKGVDYFQLIDFLSNFSSEDQIVEVGHIKDMLKISKKIINFREFYTNITDKNYKFDQEKNQTKFVQRVESYVNQTKDKYKSVNNMTMGLLNKSKKQSAKEFANVSNNLNSNSEVSMLRDVTSSPEKQKKSIFHKMIESKKKKALNLKVFGRFFNLVDKNSTDQLYLVPVVSKITLDFFMNDLKEYQTDMTKKISENLLKNQRMLTKIVNENTNKINMDIGQYNRKERADSEYSFEDRERWLEMEERMKNLETQNAILLKHVIAIGEATRRRPSRIMRSDNKSMTKPIASDVCIDEQEVSFSESSVMLESSPRRDVRMDTENSDAVAHIEYIDDK